jgi:hypothetical protein
MIKGKREECGREGMEGWKSCGRSGSNDGIKELYYVVACMGVLLFLLLQLYKGFMIDIVGTLKKAVSAYNTLPINLHRCSFSARP